MWWTKEGADAEAAAGIKYFLEKVVASGMSDKFVRRNKNTNRWEIAMPRKEWIEKHSNKWRLTEETTEKPTVNKRSIPKVNPDLDKSPASSAAGQVSTPVPPKRKKAKRGGTETLEAAETSPPKGKAGAKLPEVWKKVEHVKKHLEKGLKIAGDIKKAVDNIECWKWAAKLDDFTDLEGTITVAENTMAKAKFWSDLQLEKTIADLRKNYDDEAATNHLREQGHELEALAHRMVDLSDTIKRLHKARLAKKR